MRTTTATQHEEAQPGIGARAWRRLVAAGLAATGLFLVSPHGGVVQAAVVVASGLAATVAFAWRATSERDERPAWWLFAVSFGLLTTANVVWSIGRLAFDYAPYPSLADAFYLCAYAFLLVACVRGRIAAAERGSGLDASITVAGLGAIVWILVIEPAGSASGASLLARAVAVAYPVLDLMVLWVLARAALAGHLSSSRGLQLLAVGILAQLLADIVNGAALVRGAYVQGGPIDAGWVLLPVLAGAAALDPTTKLGVRAGDALHLARWRLAALGAASVVAPLSYLAQSADHFFDPATVTSLASLAVILLVLSRVCLLVKRIQTQALHDALTGLPNRAVLLERTRRALREGATSKKATALVLVDLDDFKAVNDTFGHLVGDELLVAVARRFGEALRSDDTLVRLGGDEFAVVLEGLEPGAASAGGVVDRMLAALEAPIVVGGHEVYVGASAGIRVAGAHGAADVADLLRDADAAMYAAKADGKNRWTVFEPAMAEAARLRMNLEADLRRAVEQREFVVQYQPIVEIETGDPVAVEALCRWQHPVRGLVPPADFIPVAEETGLIIEIGRLVLEQSCRQVALWHRLVAAERRPRLSVNVSVRQLRDPNFVRDLTETLATTGLPAHFLALEITESLLVTHAAQELAALRAIDALGIRVHIDDFGTGYSSLSYIGRLPIDAIKIDRGFVAGVHLEGESAVAQAICHVGQMLEFQLIAEGIERPEQAERLLELGCRFGQGFLYSPPRDADEITHVLLRGGALGPHGGVSWAQHSVLVVDDDDLAREATARAFRQLGVEVFEAATAGEAIGLAVARVPDVAVLDVNLPDMTGFELAERLRLHPATRHVPVLYLTGEALSLTDMVRAQKTGAAVYLTRPVALDEVVRATEAVLVAS